MISEVFQIIEGSSSLHLYSPQTERAIFVVFSVTFTSPTAVTAGEVLLLVVCVCNDACNFVRETSRIDGIWDHAIKFARWQHHAMVSGRCLLCPALLSIITFVLLTMTRYSAW